MSEYAVLATILFRVVIRRFALCAGTIIWLLSFVSAGDFGDSHICCCHYHPVAVFGEQAGT